MLFFCLWVKIKLGFSKNYIKSLVFFKMFVKGDVIKQLSVIGKDMFMYFSFYIFLSGWLFFVCLFYFIVFDD